MDILFRNSINNFYTKKLVKIGEKFSRNMFAREGERLKY